MGHKEALSHGELQRKLSVIRYLANANRCRLIYRKWTADRRATLESRGYPLSPVTAPRLTLQSPILVQDAASVALASLIPDDQRKRNNFGQWGLF